MSDGSQTGREDCYICGRGHADLLETHHIVPRRLGGGDHEDNLVDLCPTCHRALESLYDERFYRTLGVGSDSEIVDFVGRTVEEALEELEAELSAEIWTLRDTIARDFVGYDGGELDSSLADTVGNGAVIEDGGDLLDAVAAVAEEFQGVASGEGVPVEEIHRHFETTDWSREEVDEALSWHYDRGHFLYAQASNTRLKWIGRVEE